MEIRFGSIWCYFYSDDDGYYYHTSDGGNSISYSSLEEAIAAAKAEVEEINQFYNSGEYSGYTVEETGQQWWSESDEDF